mgnify:CR=1 FL=1
MMIPRTPVPILVLRRASLFKGWTRCVPSRVPLPFLFSVQLDVPALPGSCLFRLLRGLARFILSLFDPVLSGVPAVTTAGRPPGVGLGLPIGVPGARLLRSFFFTLRVMRCRLSSPALLGRLHALARHRGAGGSLLPLRASARAIHAGVGRSPVIGSGLSRPGRSLLRLGKVGSPLAINAPVARSPARRPLRPFVEQAWLLPPMAGASVAVELAAPVALLGGRLRTVWVVSAWLMHAAIAALMLVGFPYPLFLVAFALFFELERAVERVGGWWRARRATSA